MKLLVGPRPQLVCVVMLHFSAAWSGNGNSQHTFLLFPFRFRLRLDSPKLTANIKDQGIYAPRVSPENYVFFITLVKFISSKFRSKLIIIKIL